MNSNEEVRTSSSNTNGVRYGGVSRKNRTTYVVPEGGSVVVEEGNSMTYNVVMGIVILLVLWILLWLVFYLQGADWTKTTNGDHDGTKVAVVSFVWALIVGFIILCLKYRA